MLCTIILESGYNFDQVSWCCGKILQFSTDALYFCGIEITENAFAHKKKLCFFFIWFHFYIPCVLTPLQSSARKLFYKHYSTTTTTTTTQDATKIENKIDVTARRAYNWLCVRTVCFLINLTNVYRTRTTTTASAAKLIRTLTKWIY